jgi:thioredoxin-like negative regulator of GroEL
MWLTDLKLFWVVMSAVPEAASDDTDDAAKAVALAEKAKWDEANEACLSRLLNVLSNRLFDVYSGFTSSKGL